MNTKSKRPTARESRPIGTAMLDGQLDSARDKAPVGGWGQGLAVLWPSELVAKCRSKLAHVALGHQ
jgi:hypothetical protein